MVYSENTETYVERGRGVAREYYDVILYYGNMAVNISTTTTAATTNTTTTTTTTTTITTTTTTATTTTTTIIIIIIIIIINNSNFDTRRMSIKRMWEASCKLNQGFQLADYGTRESGHVVLYGLRLHS